VQNQLELRSRTLPLMRNISGREHGPGIVLLLAATLAVPAQKVTPPNPADPQRCLNDIKKMMDEEGGPWRRLEGMTRAERVLAERYKSLGFEPAGRKGYLQPFTVKTGPLAFPAPERLQLRSYAAAKVPHETNIFIADCVE
jgi:hypothetical protein